MSKRPWFRVRRSGLGWTPITWEGWLMTAALALAFAAVDGLLIAHVAATAGR